jgi:hypothetical protein
MSYEKSTTNTKVKFDAMILHLINLNRITDCFIVKYIFVYNKHMHVITTGLISNILVLTILVLLTNEIRFRLIGRRTSMQLKFRHTADARAHARVDCP